MTDPHSTDEDAGRSATLADDEIETRPLGSAGAVPGDDTGDSGDDSSTA